ncbi:MAG TPA: hypothetical protein VKV03_14665 [Candidatus Binataceae bacterium]|nr:hypothetical protein [Candidatus Binataceae bacterium]
MVKLGGSAAIAVACLLTFCRVADATPISGALTYHYDNARDGQNLGETILTPTNVNSTTFGKLFSRTVDGYVYAEPLYVNGIQIPHVGATEVVYVATEHDSVYAFDAGGARVAPFWHVSFLSKKPRVSTVTWAQVGSTDIVPEIGITGTPVIDPVSNTLYVAAKTFENPNFVYRLHALDLATGAEKFGGPVVIAASAPGTGDANHNGSITFDAHIANQRSGLALSNGVVYLPFASHGDNGQYHGWILGYDASTLEQVSSFIDTPNGSLGGIWMAGGAPVIDSDGNLLVATGNGTFDEDEGGLDYGDSLVKLGPTDTSNLDVIDYFTPFDQFALAQMDLDLGSGGVIELPDQSTGPIHLAVTGGKEGTLYLVDCDNMGHFNATDNSQIVQSIMGQMPSVFSTPAYFNGTVYIGGEFDNLKAFSLSNGQLSTSPTSETSTFFQYPGATPVISANGSQDGIVWAIANQTVAALYAFDATNLANQLYISTEKRERDAMTGYVKFSVPTVANGRVFVGSQKRLTVFGSLKKK